MMLLSAQGSGGACTEGSPEEGRGPRSCHGERTHPGQQVMFAFVKVKQSPQREQQVRCASPGSKAKSVWRRTHSLDNR